MMMILMGLIRDDVCMQRVPPVAPAPCRSRRSERPFGQFLQPSELRAVAVYRRQPPQGPTGNVRHWEIIQDDDKNSSCPGRNKVRIALTKVPLSRFPRFPGCWRPD